MARNGADDLVTRGGLGNLGDGMVPQVVKAEPRQARHGRNSLLRVTLCGDCAERRATQGRYYVPETSIS